MISAELFFQLAKIEGLLWSVSDFFMIFFFIKFVNVIRKQNNLKTYRKLYYLLYLSFCITPLILFTKDLFSYFLVEIIVLNIQYFILIYIMIKNYKLIQSHLKSI